jgi:peptidyl-dipeptidase Dcp
MTYNSLLQDFDTPFGTAPFEQIEEEHYLPALEKAIANGLKEVEAIAKNTEPPTFQNVIEALENSGEKVERISSIFFNLNSAETNENIQALAREISPKLTSYGNDIMLNQDLFERVKAVWEQRESLDLTTEQFLLLEKTYQGFTRNGANLSEADKEKLRELDEKLAQHSLQYGENVLAATNAYQLFCTEEEVAGLPTAVKEMAAQEAEEAGEKGKYLISLQMPSYLPFMTYAHNRALREKLFKAQGTKAFTDSQFDNSAHVLAIAQLRHQRAQLLGFSSHADFVLAKRMAKSPSRVYAFLEELKEPALPAAKNELEELKAFAEKTDGLKDLQRWDLAYYSEKLKQARYQIDDELLKPYFEQQSVLQGAFKVAKKLYGLTFHEREDIQKYHPDITTYEVKDAEGKHLAVFYADFFPRKGKRSGAWMTVYRQQKVIDGQEVRPHISIVCNFTKPGKNTPSLLTFNEVLTLFHEFGHALHGMLAQGHYASLTGTNVYWDFVELPSQIMENWCYEKECLDLFAKHYQTGEPIPQEYVERLRKSATFMEGRATVRQLSFATLDMSWHAQSPENIKDVGQHEAAIFKPFSLLPAVAGTNMSCQFGHIFQGGYAAGYYSYKWAEVLDADAFELFKEKGLFNPEVAQAFKKLLASGGTVKPNELYRNFRGQDPDPKALLRRAGLIQKNGKA